MSINFLKKSSCHIHFANFYNEMHVYWLTLKLFLELVNKIVPTLAECIMIQLL